MIIFYAVASNKEAKGDSAQGFYGFIEGDISFVGTTDIVGTVEFPQTRYYICGFTNEADVVIVDKFLGDSIAPDEFLEEIERCTVARKKAQLSKRPARIRNRRVWQK